MLAYLGKSLFGASPADVISQFGHNWLQGLPLLLGAEGWDVQVKWNNLVKQGVDRLALG